MNFKELKKKIVNRINSYIKPWRYNSLAFQKSHWAEELRRYDWYSQKLCGYEWGNPEKANDPLGNYLKVKNDLVGLVYSDSTVLEIGSLGGKWTQYLLHAKKIICVDINDVGFAYIRWKLPKANIEFYLTKGNELNGIPSDSVDLVFSLDTFVRVPRSYIAAYIRESQRVLKQGGSLFFHLPCDLKRESVGRWFTRLSEQQILQMCCQAGFDNPSIDTQTLNHGVILKARKE